MRRFSLLNRLGSMKNVSVAGSLVTPLVDKRLVPYPYIMMWVVTRRCNSHCRMCSIWKDRESPCMSVQQAESIFSGNDWSFLRSLAITGGEPTVRSDLPELFEIALNHCSRLEHVLLATNGLATERVVEQATLMLDLLNTVENQVYRFDVQISLDGLGQVHDMVRGIEGFFGRVNVTLDRLRAMKDTFPRLNLGLSSVLMPYNLPYVDELCAFAERNQLRIYFSPAVLEGEYYNNLDGADELVFTENDSAVAASRFFERLSEAEASSLRFYYRDMAKMILGERRGRRCMMGFYGFVLEHDGTVYPCVNCERAGFGNLLTDPFDKAWFGANGDEVRLKLRDLCCPNCTSLCYTLPVNAIEVADLIWRQEIRPRLKGSPENTSS